MNKKLIKGIFFILFFLTLTIRSTDLLAWCGDGVCEPGETTDNCPFDCKVAVPVNPCDGKWCGDGICSTECGETTSSCPADCKVAVPVNPCNGKWCGDGICNAECGETTSSCPADCKVVLLSSPCDSKWCGNGVCDTECGETVSNCPVDCKKTTPVNPCDSKWCGNGICDTECGETVNNCPVDCALAPVVNLKANNSSSTITITYNTAATLSWTAKNATSCTASGDWSGSKNLSGSELTEKLTSAKTYTITCKGPGGSVSDSVKVNVTAAPTSSKGSSSSSSSSTSTEIYIKKTVKNVTQNTLYYDSVAANPKDILSFGIVVKAGDRSVYDVIVKDILGDNLIYRGSLKVDDVAVEGDIFKGLDLGSFSAKESKTITFLAEVEKTESFSFGQNKLINTATVSGRGVSASDQANVIVEKTKVAGATDIATGLTNNVFVDSFVIPLGLTGIIFWLLRSHIVKYEEWLDERKKQYREYKSKKTLRTNVNRIRLKEFFNKKLTF